MCEWTSLLPLHPHSEAFILHPAAALKLVSPHLDLHVAKLQHQLGSHFNHMSALDGLFAKTLNYSSYNVARFR